MRFAVVHSVMFLRAQAHEVPTQEREGRIKLDGIDMMYRVRRDPLAVSLRLLTGIFIASEDRFPFGFPSAAFVIHLFTPLKKPDA